MDTHMCSDTSIATSSSLDSPLLSDFWPDLFASDRQLPKAPREPVSGMLQYTESDYHYSNRGIVPDQSCQHGDEMILDHMSNDVMICGEGNIMDIDNIDDVMKQFLNMGSDISSVGADAKQKKRADPTGYSLHPGHSSSEMKEPVAHTPTLTTGEGEPDVVEVMSTSGSLLTVVSDVSALDPEKSRKSILAKRRAGVKGSKTMVRRSERIRLQQILAFLERYEDDDEVQSVKKEYINRWLNNIDFQSPL